MKIRRSHALGVDEAMHRIGRVVERLENDYQLRSSRNADGFQVQGSGVNGLIRVAYDFVEVDLRLGFALGLVESTIRAGIEKAMDEQL